VRFGFVTIVLGASLALDATASAKRGIPGFPLGVAAEEVISTSALLWARAPKAAT
jgi:phosphodiesterase/alkaline phosphatase D-like protein